MRMTQERAVIYISLALTLLCMAGFIVVDRFWPVDAVDVPSDGPAPLFAAWVLYLVVGIAAQIIAIMALVVSFVKRRSLSQWDHLFAEFPVILWALLYAMIFRIV